MDAETRSSLLRQENLERVGASEHCVVADGIENVFELLFAFLDERRVVLAAEERGEVGLWQWRQQGRVGQLGVELLEVVEALLQRHAAVGGFDVVVDNTLFSDRYSAHSVELRGSWDTWRGGDCSIGAAVLGGAGAVGGRHSSRLRNRSSGCVGCWGSGNWFLDRSGLSAAHGGGSGRSTWLEVEVGDLLQIEQ